MKIYTVKQTIISLALLVGVSISGCKLIDPPPDYKVAEDPLIVRGDSVEVKVDVQFHPESFHKKAIISATPVLYHENGEDELKTETFQGEEVPENHITVPNKAGKSHTYVDKLPYKESYKESKLKVKLVAKKGDKTKKITSDKIADGVITTPYLMMDDDKPIMAKDNFQRTTTHTMEPKIHYRISSPKVRRSELRKKDIKKFETLLDSIAKNEKKSIKSMKIEAYAYPDGELSKNSDLAKNRAKSAKKYVMGEMKDRKIKAGQKDGFYSLNPKGEDWKGFKKAMKASDIKDKDIIIRILGKYSGEKREKEIKNVAKTYKVIADKILPNLRRSRMKLTYEIVGKTNEELVKLAKSNPDSLKIEEIMKAGSLIDDMNEKLSVYKAAAKNHPNDWRPANNVGYIYMQQNKISKAEKQFKKAKEVEQNPIVSNNLAIVKRMKGNREKAMTLLEAASGAGSEVSYNKGLIHIQNGMYDKAIKAMGDNNTFNLALVKLLSGDLEGAQKALDKAPSNSTAKGKYLQAIIHTRNDKPEDAVKALESAISKDASLKSKAKEDLEFQDLRSNEDFKSMVGMSSS
ncbi:MAG: tetratricopeptide repeat protein [Flavobacteriales bacterium]